MSQATYSLQETCRKRQEAFVVMFTTCISIIIYNYYSLLLLYSYSLLLITAGKSTRNFDLAKSDVCFIDFSTNDHTFSTFIIKQKITSNIVSNCTF